MKIIQKLKKAMGGQERNKLFQLILLLITLSFVIRPMLSQNYAVSFALNNSILDFSLLSAGAAIFVFILLTRPSKTTAIFCIFLAVFVAAKSLVLPSLVSIGLGSRIGIDNWDALGHTIYVLNNMQYPINEPYFLVMERDVIHSISNPIPPTFFLITAFISMLFRIDPLIVHKNIFVFGLFQPVLIYLVVRKITNDEASSVLSALFIASGSVFNDNTLFSSGFASPIESLALLLFLASVYSMKFRPKLFYVMLMVLINIHLFTAILLVLLFFIYRFHTLKFLKRLLNFREEKLTGTIIYAVKKIAPLLITLLVGLSFWYLPMLARGDSFTGIHQTEVIDISHIGEVLKAQRFTFNRNGFILSVSGGTTYYEVYYNIPIIFLLLLALGVYYSAKKRERLLLAWVLSLSVVTLFLLIANARVSYRTVAYIIQVACATGGCGVAMMARGIIARGDSENSRSRGSIPKSKYGNVMSFLFILAISGMVFGPVFIDAPPNVDGAFLPKRGKLTYYYSLATWAKDNLPHGSVVIVDSPWKYNDSQFLSHPINLLRHFGTTIVVGNNLGEMDYKTVSKNFTYVYIINSSLFRTENLTSQIIFSNNEVSLYNLSLT
jgi:hypothetical protein